MTTTTSKQRACAGARCTLLLVLLEWFIIYCKKKNIVPLNTSFMLNSTYKCIISFIKQLTH